MPLELGPTAPPQPDRTEPGPRFREDLFERAPCPRVHSKIVVVDARIAFVGSPDLTGAGLGPKAPIAATSRPACC